MKLPHAFSPGEASPFLSAGLLNERIMWPLISLMNSRGENGIEIVKADGGWAFRLKDRRLSNAPGGGEGAGLIWGGDWFDTDWALNTVVIRQETADFANGNVAGTYVAIDEVPSGTPAPGESGAEDFWELLARGNWDRLKFVYGDVIIDVDATAGRLQIKDTVTLSEIDLKLSDCGGKRLYVQEVDDCTGGVAGHRRILASDKY